MEMKKSSNSSGIRNMTTISQEEESFVRLCLLMSGISTRAVQALFNIEFNPSELKASIKKATIKLIKLRKDKIINLSQWNLLFPRNGRFRKTTRQVIC